MPPRNATLWASLLLAATTLFGCLSAPAVVRVVDGHEVHGRFVRSDAYALFMEGMLAEGHGHLAAAERLYLAAHRRDPKGVSILVRLAAVRCAWGPGGHEPARATFEDALKLDASYAPAHVERARCAIRRGALGEAEVDARTALSLAPDDSAVSLLLADVLEQVGRGEQAAQVLDGLAFAHPSQRAWQAVASLARRRGDAVRMRAAARRLGGRDAGLPAYEEVDEALVRADLSRARDLAGDAGMDAGTLAVRAAALGQWAVAREQARLVLAAEPGHADATAVWLSSPTPWEAFRSMDPAVWRRLVTVPVHSSRTLSDLGALVLADAIRRRIGPDAAASWLAVRGMSPDIDREPLARPLLARLRLAASSR
jgi:thioredoxin-like negative regulator of GroEL